MPETSDAPVRSEQRGRVKVLTLDRPEARNAVNAAVTAALSAHLDAAAADGEVWAVVLTGSGDKVFSAGMDLKAAATGNIAGVINEYGFGGLVRRDFPKPLIAAVNGAALAG